jgi:hypothetical protein
MNRKTIEQLILMISPTTDVHLFPKRNLPAVLAHEILHLKMQMERATTKPATPQDDTITPADEFFTLSDELPSWRAVSAVDDYDKTWGSPVGQDCIDLCSALPRWLGERLTFLGKHTNSAPIGYHDTFGDEAAIVWKGDLIRKGAALTRAANLNEYDTDLSDSDIADVKQAGDRMGGSITAALFLQDFVAKDVAWAHLDIAGTVWCDKGRGDCPPGATGFGVRTLVGWIQAGAPA